MKNANIRCRQTGMRSQYMKKHFSYEKFSFFNYTTVIFLLAFFVSGRLAAEEQGQLQNITFATQWYPQAQFAGYYVANANGIYEQYGLNVTIVSGDSDVPSSQYIAQKRADFGSTMLPTAIQKRVQGIPLVNIGQLVKKSSQMLIAYKDSGIRTPEDFRAKRVSMWPDYRLQPLAFFKKFGVDLGTDNIITQGYTINLFLKKGVDATSAMWYNEYHTIINSGVNRDELVTFMMADYGIDFLEDGIYCLEETLKNKPKLASAFIQASNQGWEYAFAHPAKALDIVMKYVNEANLPTNRVHQKWMLNKMEKLIRPRAGISPISTLCREDYAYVARQLFENGLIGYIPEYQSFHEPRFVTP